MNALIQSAKYSVSLRHMSNHYHDRHQIIYVTQGYAKITVSGRTYDAVPGTMIIISRFEQHSIQICSDNYQRYTLEIAPETARYRNVLGDRVLSVLINRPDRFCHAADMRCCPEAEQILSAMVKEYEQKGSNYSTILDLMLLHLLFLLNRHHPEMIPDESKNIALIRDIQQLFETEYENLFTLEDLAKKYHMSQSHLSHLFRKTTGQSVMGYLTACRLAAAKRALTETDEEISTIVENCGFSDNSNFSRTFKKETGLTPTQFREKFRPR